MGIAHCKYLPRQMENAEQRQRTIEQIAANAQTVATGVAVRDYDSGRDFQLAADRSFHAASTIKVAVLLAVFRALDQGKLQLDDPLHVQNRFLSAVDAKPFALDSDSDGYPQLYKSIGRTAKIGDLADVMITSSSNLATNLLLDFITVEYARDVLREAGVSGVELKRGVSDENAHAAGLNNETSAQGMVDLFGTLRGDFLSRTSREAVIAILLRQRFDSMLPAQLPSHATVAHKTGEISTASHDCGIVYLPERQPYVVAILTEVKADADQRRETVAKISKAIFDFIVGEPPA
jgi:beta-lactamase class A